MVQKYKDDHSYTKSYANKVRAGCIRKLQEMDCDNFDRINTEILRAVTNLLSQINRRNFHIKKYGTDEGAHYGS